MTLYDNQSELLKIQTPDGWESGSGQDPITREAIVIDGTEVGSILRNVLSKPECDHFISATRHQMLEVNYFKEYRNMQRVVADSEAISEVIFGRIGPFLADPLVVGEETRSFHQASFRSCHGSWRPYGLSTRWRFCSYNPGGHFSPHYDGRYEVSISNQSLQTCQLYLNGGFTGGGINFLSEVDVLHEDSQKRFRAEESNILLSIQPEPGMAVIFNHRLMHEGEPLEHDPSNPGQKKFFMRSEVMFKNESYVAEADQNATNQKSRGNKHTDFCKIA